MDNSGININNFANNYQPRKRVAIVDDFSGAEKHLSIDINRDGKPELHHGNMVEGAFKAAGNHKKLPEVKRVQTLFNAASLNEKCNEVLSLNNDKDSSNNVDFVNLSQGKTWFCKSIKDKDGNYIGFKTDVDTKKIKAAVKNFNMKEEDSYINTLEKLAKTAKVYMSAGNDGISCFNAYNIADGVKSIGGNDTSGKPHQDSGNNSLVDGWAPFEFEGELVKGKGGKSIGYDVHPKGQKGDGVPDILFGNEEGQVKLTGWRRPDKKIAFDGTSFSAPYRLGQDSLKNID